LNFKNPFLSRGKTLTPGIQHQVFTKAERDEFNNFYIKNRLKWPAGDF
jgi:hypothetical protein